MWLFKSIILQYKSMLFTHSTFLDNCLFLLSMFLMYILYRSILDLFGLFLQCIIHKNKVFLQNASYCYKGDYISLIMWFFMISGLKFVLTYSKGYNCVVY